MKKGKLLCLVFSLFFLGFVLYTSPAIAQIKLTYSVFFPAPHKNAVLATDWAKEIEKRTNGRVQITVFPGGTLTPADKCYDGVCGFFSVLPWICPLHLTRNRTGQTHVLSLFPCPAQERGACYGLGKGD